MWPLGTWKLFDRLHSTAPRGVYFTCKRAFSRGGALDHPQKINAAERLRPVAGDDERVYDVT